MLLFFEIQSTKIQRRVVRITQAGQGDIAYGLHGTIYFDLWDYGLFDLSSLDSQSCVCVLNIIQTKNPTGDTVLMQQTFMQSNGVPTGVGYGRGIAGTNAQNIHDPAPPPPVAPQPIHIRGPSQSRNHGNLNTGGNTGGNTDPAIVNQLNQINARLGAIDGTLQAMNDVLTRLSNSIQAVSQHTASRQVQSFSIQPQ